MLDGLNIIYGNMKQQLMSPSFIQKDFRMSQIHNYSYSSLLLDLVRSNEKAETCKLPQNVVKIGRYKFGSISIL